jgi:serine hydrolase
MRPPATALILPGLSSSGPEHWQTLWEQRDPSLRRVEQAEWETPRCADWVTRLDDAIASAEEPVVLVAHSSSCALVAHWARDASSENLARVRSALLVAPSDPEGPNFPSGPTGFAPMPLERLPFPSIVVASRDDRYVTMERARRRVGERARGPRRGGAHQRRERARSVADGLRTPPAPARRAAGGSRLAWRLRGVARFGRRAPALATPVEHQHAPGHDGRGQRAEHPGGSAEQVADPGHAEPDRQRAGDRDEEPDDVDSGCHVALAGERVADDAYVARRGPPGQASRPTACAKSS